MLARYAVVVCHQFITLTVYICVQHGGHEAPRRAGLSAADLYKWLIRIEIGCSISATQVGWLGLRVGRKYRMKSRNDFGMMSVS